MQPALSFVQDYLQNQMIFNVSNTPIIYSFTNPSQTNRNPSQSLLHSKSDSLQINQPNDIKINSIDFVEQRQDGSRVKKRVTNQTLEQFIDSSRKKHLTQFLTERNSRKRRERSQSPVETLEQRTTKKIFHIGCDYRLKPKFQQHRYWETN